MRGKERQNKPSKRAALSGSYRRTELHKTRALFPNLGFMTPYRRIAPKGLTLPAEREFAKGSASFAHN